MTDMRVEPQSVAALGGRVLSAGQELSSAGIAGDYALRGAEAAAGHALIANALYEMRQRWSASLGDLAAAVESGGKNVAAAAQAYSRADGSVNGMLG